MPQIRYTFSEEGEEFSETEYIKVGEDASRLVNEKILAPLNLKRRERGEPELVLVKIKEINPYVHAHDWWPKRQDDFAEKIYFMCSRCEITGYKKTGHTLAPVTLDLKYADNQKYLLCRDPLKRMPKFRFKFD